MTGAGTETHAAHLSFPLLSAVRRLTALDTVRARIAMAVDLGLLQPGDRLPEIRAVASALAVSEITVRRALMSLTGDGVLTRRRGRTGATYVASQPTRRAVPRSSPVRDTCEQPCPVLRQVAAMCADGHTSKQAVSDAQIVASRLRSMSHVGIAEGPGRTQLPPQRGMSVRPRSRESFCWQSVGSGARRS